MSKNRNRAKLNKANTNQEYRKIFLREMYPPYWDDGCFMFPRYRSGFKNPNKQLFPYQVRMYRTWKYNRKTQWK
jgi:hypothetical protein